jgi:propanol-preferring alcohol dehydrogenase
MRFVEVSPGRLELLSGEPARPAEGEVRVRVRACGICGTDLHLLHGMTLPRGADYPVRPGHEVAGQVIETAAPDAGVRVGDQVVLHPLAPCGRCAACRSGRDRNCGNARVLGIHAAGGLADEVIWPASRMVVTHGLEPLSAAILADAVATAYRALRLAELHPGESLCVLGAGGVGTHVLELARILHPDVQLVGVVNSPASADRLTGQGFQVERGVDRIGARMRDRFGSIDAVVDFSGAAAAPGQATRMLAPGGRLIFGSVLEGTLDVGAAMTVQTKELSVKGVYASSLQDLRDVVDLAARPDGLDLGPSVTHTLALEDAAQAFALLESRPPGLVRMVITV